jgi:hypothetical protein
MSEVVAIKVSAILEDRHKHLGYISPNEPDANVQAFFDDDKGYGLHYEEVRLTKIPMDCVRLRRDIAKKKAELASLESQLCPK